MAKYIRCTISWNGEWQNNLIFKRHWKIKQNLRWFSKRMSSRLLCKLYTLLVIYQSQLESHYPNVMISLDDFFVHIPFYMLLRRILYRLVLISFEVFLLKAHYIQIINSLNYTLIPLFASHVCVPVSFCTRKLTVEPKTLCNTLFTWRS